MKHELKRERKNGLICFAERQKNPNRSRDAKTKEVTGSATLPKREADLIQAVAACQAEKRGSALHRPSLTAS